MKKSQMMKNRCRDCRRPMTWAAVRVQYGRLMRRSFRPDQVKQILPRCGKCLTVWLRSQPAIVPARDAVDECHDADVRDEDDRHTDCLAPTECGVCSATRRSTPGGSLDVRYDTLQGQCRTVPQWCRDEFATAAPLG